MHDLPKCFSCIIKIAIFHLVYSCNYSTDYERFSLLKHLIVKIVFWTLRISKVCHHIIIADNAYASLNVICMLTFFCKRLPVTVHPVHLAVYKKNGSRLLGIFMTKKNITSDSTDSGIYIII